VIRQSDDLIPIEAWYPGLEAVRGIAAHGGPSSGPTGPRVPATAVDITEMEVEMGRLAVTTAMEEVMPMAVIMAATATDLQPRELTHEHNST
jgi:hypothetical protein